MGGGQGREQVVTSLPYGLGKVWREVATVSRPGKRLSYVIRLQERKY